MAHIRINIYPPALACMSVAYNLARMLIIINYMLLIIRPLPLIRPCAPSSAIYEQNYRKYLTDTCFNGIFCNKYDKNDFLDYNCS